MVPTAIREDPLTQYLLGFSLVVLAVGTVGGIAQMLHTSELPSLTYVGTVLVPAVVLIAATAVYHRLFYSPDESEHAPAKQRETESTEPNEEVVSEATESVENSGSSEKRPATDEAEINTE